MSYIKLLIKKIRWKRALYLQLLFTVFAFWAMAVLSYFFMSGIVRSHLTKNSENVLNLLQEKINTDLILPQTALKGFSETVRNMILKGYDSDHIQEYINSLSEYSRINGIQNSNIDSFYGYFETLKDSPVFLNGNGWIPPDNYSPADRPWYKFAVEAGGDVTETPHYIDAYTGEMVLTYARCIYDDEGKRLGIVARDVHLEAINSYVVSAALAKGGYGTLINRELTVITHYNKDFVGKNLQSSLIPISVFKDEILAGNDINEVPLTTYTGESGIAFLRKLQNGWYIGLISPQKPYYQSVIDMGRILGILATLSALVTSIILTRINTAREKADIESMRKSTFLSNMSHEIRTPMNAIIGMTAIGKSAATSERKDYCLAKIEEAGRHLLGVINDVLDMSKIEADKLELLPAEFDFEKILQQVINVAMFRIDEKHQKIKIHIDSAIPEILIVDGQRLTQVMTNLLGNAVKFTPEQGSISINTHLLKEEDDGACVIQIAINDSGIGISPEQQLKLFQPFQQAEASTMRKYGGTGLGLAISQKIVRMMGGNIWIESALGEGATFIFTIKVKRGTSVRQGLSVNGINRDNIRVLVTDSDPDILKYFKEIMQKNGIHCDTAANGEDALKFARRNNPYHICFIDWHIPDMSGLTLAKTLSAVLPNRDYTVFIMVSDFEKNIIEDEAKRAGVEKFLSKPMFPSAIIDAINDTLGVTQRQPVNVQPGNAVTFIGRHILLVEDIDVNREILQALLKPTLVNIDCAVNGAEAVSMFSESPGKYDIILMDIQMPEMDGYEATRRIRALDIPNAKSIPIIAMTANVFRKDIQSCMNAGMNGHLGKPIDYNDVIDKLRIYLVCR
ncbi:MAG: response regulator [Deferribacteraceae bacterium]|jgi:signal transduction histidine kinase/CheY-like chemotaxis protein|nr:response regulator [Deferribacteraceae bacterium]